jgi:hypothetical protein
MISLKEARTAAVADHDFMTKGPELEARMAAVREEHKKQDQLLISNRQAYDNNKVSLLHMLTI